MEGPALWKSTWRGQTSQTGKLHTLFRLRNQVPQAQACIHLDKFSVPLCTTFYCVRSLKGVERPILAQQWVFVCWGHLLVICSKHTALQSELRLAPRESGESLIAQTFVKAQNFFFMAKVANYGVLHPLWISKCLLGFRANQLNFNVAVPSNEWRLTPFASKWS